MPSGSRREGKLLLQHCADCGHVQYYQQALCRACGHENLVHRPATGRGKVHSFSVVHRAPGPAFKADVPYDHPVSSLDIVPTALAAAGVDGANLKGHPLDGINLLPYLTDSRHESPHSILYWRWMGQLAARQGQWKLVKKRDSAFQLFDLASDLGETQDLAASRPEIARSLEQSIWDWNARLVEPLWRLPAEQETLRKAYTRPQ